MSFWVRRWLPKSWAFSNFAGRVSFCFITQSLWKLKLTFFFRFVEPVFPSVLSKVLTRSVGVTAMTYKKALFSHFAGPALLYLITGPLKNKADLFLQFSRTRVSLFFSKFERVCAGVTAVTAKKADLFSNFVGPVPPDLFRRGNGGDFFPIL